MFLTFSSLLLKMILMLRKIFGIVLLVFLEEQVREQWLLGGTMESEGWI